MFISSDEFSFRGRFSSSEYLFIQPQRIGQSWISLQHQMESRQIYKQCSSISRSHHNRHHWFSSDLSLENGHFFNPTKLCTKGPSLIDCTVHRDTSSDGNLPTSQPLKSYIQHSAGQRFVGCWFTPQHFAALTLALGEGEGNGASKYRRRRKPTLASASVVKIRR